MEKIEKNFSVTDEPISMCNSLKNNYNKSVDFFKKLEERIAKLEAEKEKGKK